MDLTTETDRQRLERTLDADPTDWGLRLLLADVLEEAGEDVTAWGQRWQASSRKFPMHNRLAPGGQPWSWWRADHDRHPYLRLPARLLARVFVLLGDGVSYAIRPIDQWRTYPTRAAAEADLARALVILPDRGASFLPPAVECRQSSERRTCLT